MNLKDLADLVNISRNLSAIVALCVGGFWSYLLFIRRRQKFPRANFAHSLVSKRLTNEKSLLHLCVSISNAGEVLVSLEAGEVLVQQILPITPELSLYISKGGDPVKEGKTEIEWCLICERLSKWKKGQLEIEPGETHSINYDFIIDASVECVEVCSRYVNPVRRKRNLVWELVTIHELNRS